MIKRRDGFLFEMINCELRVWMWMCEDGNGNEICWWVVFGLVPKARGESGEEIPFSWQSKAKRWNFELISNYHWWIIGNSVQLDLKFIHSASSGIKNHLNTTIIVRLDMPFLKSYFSNILYAFFSFFFFLCFLDWIEDFLIEFVNEQILGANGRISISDYDKCHRIFFNIFAQLSFHFTRPTTTTTHRILQKWFNGQINETRNTHLHLGHVTDWTECFCDILKPKNESIPYPYVSTSAMNDSIFFSYLAKR